MDKNFILFLGDSTDITDYINFVEATPNLSSLSKDRIIDAKSLVQNKVFPRIKLIVINLSDIKGAKESQTPEQTVRQLETGIPEFKDLPKILLTQTIKELGFITFTGRNVDSAVIKVISKERTDPDRFITEITKVIE